MFWVKENASKREWTLFMAFALLAELALLYAFRDSLWGLSLLSDNKAVVDAVSFAGTVVSIILGVLAIIYTLFQGFSQQSGAEKISAQLVSLEKLVGTAQKQGISLDGSLDQLQRISDAMVVVQQQVSDVKVAQDDQAKNSVEAFKRQEEALQKLAGQKGEAVASDSTIRPRALQPTTLAWNNEEKAMLISSLLGEGKDPKRVLRCLRSSFPTITAEKYFGFDTAIFTIALKTGWFDSSGDRLRARESIKQELLEWNLSTKAFPAEDDLPKLIELRTEVNALPFDET